VRVVILCGGQGTRIRGIADDLPKPMIPIGGVPILWHIMNGYAKAGFNDFVLCLGYKSHVIKDFFLNYNTRMADFSIDFGRGGAVTVDSAAKKIDWKITLVETGDNTLTGSRLKRVERYIGSDPEFMFTYGDGVSDIDLNALLAFHRTQNAVVTVSGVRPPGRFGEIEHNSSGRVKEFNEKPQATGGRISGGFFVCDRHIFDYLDAKREDQVLEAEPLQRIAREGKMAMFTHDGFWQCMDTYRDYALLNEIYEAGRAPWTR